MKKLLTVFLASLFFFPLSQASAQTTDCEEIKKENEYLKKALHILSPVKTATSGKIDFNILLCEGNTKEQTLTVTLIVTNHGPNSDLGLRKAVAIDAEGNEYETYGIRIGSGGARNKVYTDVPIRTVLEFKKVLPSVKLLKLIAVEFT